MNKLLLLIATAIIGTSAVAQPHISINLNNDRDNRYEQHNRYDRNNRHDRDDFTRVNVRKINQNTYRVERGMNGYRRGVEVILKTDRNCSIRSGMTNVNLTRDFDRGVMVSDNRECRIIDTHGLKPERNNNHHRR